MILSACHFYKKPLDLKFKRDLGQKSDNFSKMLPLNPEQALQTAETEATDEEVTAPEAANNTNSSETAIFSEKNGSGESVNPSEKATSSAETVSSENTSPSEADKPLRPQATIRQALGREDAYNFDRDAKLKQVAEVQNIPTVKQQVLRLPIVDAANYHPYIERNEYDQVINHMLFRSLFRFDKYRRLTKDLVKDYHYSYDQKLIEISLDEKALYADQTPIDAVDVIQAFNLLKDNSNSNAASKLVVSSAYFRSLDAIEKIEQVGAYDLRIYLKKPDLNLAYALTFPIVKGSELYNKGLLSFTSSGAYKQVNLDKLLAADSEEQRKQLSNFDAFYTQRSLGERPAYFNSLLQRFAVKNYASEAEAVQAFINKEIDLCYTWPAYTDKLAQYEHYVFNSLATLNLTFNWPSELQSMNSANNTNNTNTNGATNNALTNYYADIQLLKTKLSAIYNDEALFRPKDPALSPAAYAFVEDLFKPYKLIPAYPLNQLIREREKLASDFTKKTWRLLVPNDLSFGEEIVARLTHQFAKMGLKAAIKRVNLADFKRTVSTNTWDIALYPLLSHRIPDLGYELKELSNGNFWRKSRGEEFMPEFYVYPNDAQPLIDYMNNYKFTADANNPLEDVNYQQKFSKLYQYSNSMPLLKYNRALYLQDSLRGELRPFALDPLSGVEDLWIWATP